MGNSFSSLPTSFSCFCFYSTTFPASGLCPSYGSFGLFVQPLEKTTEVSKSPLEAIRILGGLASAASSSPISFSGGGGGASVPVAGSVSLDSNNIIATFTVDPKAENAKYQNGFPEGSYTFSVSGTTTPVYATVGTNRIMLDGDFDFLPGGDFSLPFNVVPDVIVSFGNIPGSILRGGIFHGGRGPGEVIHG